MGALVPNVIFIRSMLSPALVPEPAAWHATSDSSDVQGRALLSVLGGL